MLREFPVLAGLEPVAWVPEGLVVLEELEEMVLSMGGVRVCQALLRVKVFFMLEEEDRRMKLVV